MRAMRLIRAVALGLWGLAGLAACRAQAVQTPSRWSQPAADLAAQIADILGPGQAQVTIRNLSTIQASEIPSIRKLVEQDLKAHGVIVSGAESANAIRVTLSENARERLWVAEVVEGSETRVAMVHVDASMATVSMTSARMVLRSERIAGLSSRVGGIVRNDPILAASEINGHFLVIYPDRISIFSFNSWRLDRRKHNRDRRGSLHAILAEYCWQTPMEVDSRHTQPVRSASGAIPFHWLAQARIVAGRFAVMPAMIRGRCIRAVMQAARYR